jgi:hypothetical protein
VKPKSRRAFSNIFMVFYRLENLKLLKHTPQLLKMIQLHSGAEHRNEDYVGLFPPLCCGNKAEFLFTVASAGRRIVLIKAAGPSCKLEPVCRVRSSHDPFGAQIFDTFTDFA